MARAAQATTVRALVLRKESATARARESASGIVDVALAQIGDGYARGGTGPDAFDCSGLTAFVFATRGHHAAAQFAGPGGDGPPGGPRGHPPRRPRLLQHLRAGPSHVGIAVGATTVVSATNSGVMEHAPDDAYWGGHYVGARRIVG